MHDCSIIRVVFIPPVYYGCRELINWVVILPVSLLLTHCFGFVLLQIKRLSRYVGNSLRG